jgi:hypothetical protein
MGINIMLNFTAEICGDLCPMMASLNNTSTMRLEWAYFKYHVRNTWDYRKSLCKAETV